MHKEEIKDLLVQTVINNGGCKDTDLIKNRDIALNLHNISDLPKFVDELVNDGKLKKIEYILEGPHKYNDRIYKCSRIKYFLLPYNAAVNPF